MRCTAPHLAIVLLAGTLTGLSVTNVCAQASVRLTRGAITSPSNQVDDRHLAIPHVLQFSNAPAPYLRIQKLFSNLLQFECNQIHSISLSEANLPEISLVLLRDPTFWKQYKWRVIGAIALMLFQSILIMRLLLERKRTTKATVRLAESEERYRNVVETQTELICRYREDTTLTFVNDAYCRFFGKSRDQLIGSKFIERLPPHARDATREHIQSLILTRKTGMNTHEVIKPNGDIGWHEWINRVISNGHAEVEVQGIGRDVTEQKLAELALRETEECNRAILNAVPDLMFLTDRDGVFLDYHAKPDSGLLPPPKKVLGKNINELLPPKVAMALRGTFNRAMITRTTQLLECNLELNGVTNWFEARVAPCNGSKILSVVRNITDRKHALEALMNSEEFNRRIVESSVDCIKILDLEGNLLYMSQNGQRLLGIENEIDRYLNSSWLDFWPAAGKIAALEAIDRARVGEVGTFEAFGPTPDDKSKWWDTVITPILGTTGRVERLLAVSRDVTEQKLALTAIKESEERFAKSFRANPQPMSLTTLDEGLYLDVNDSFLEMSGYTRDEVIGHTSTELRIFETVGHRALLVDPLRKNKVVRNIELKFRTKTGELRVLLSSAELLEINNQTCILVASSDITERKSLEEELRLREREVSTLVENSPDVIARLDPNLRYIYISPNSKSITGMDPQSFVGKTPGEMEIPDFDWAGFESSCRQAFKSGKTVYRSFSRNGRTYSTRIIPEFSAEDAVESVMTISEDVTKRMQSDEELQKLTLQLFTLQDQERRRIARELHDGTAQNLFAISIDLANLSQLLPDDEKDRQELIAECQKLSEQSLQEIRTLSYLLHPPLLDQAGLVSALQWYVEGFKQRSGIYVNVVAQPIGRLPSEVEMALFRIVQEALTNVRRHSGSKTASIRLERKSGEVVLEIKDRGKGLRVDGHFAGHDEFIEMGVGIPGMRQRLRQLGGRLEIASDRHGTAISAVVPVAKEAGYGANSFSR